MSLENMVQYLVSNQDAPQRPFNPFPPGHIVRGSGTDVTLTFLKSQPKRWLFHHELILALGRSKGEVDWALQQLVKLGLVETVEHKERSRAPVFKYRYREEAGSSRPASTAAQASASERGRNADSFK